VNKVVCAAQYQMPCAEKTFTVVGSVFLAVTVTKLYMILAVLLVSKDSASSSCKHSVNSRTRWNFSVKNSRYFSQRNCLGTRWFVYLCFCFLWCYTVFGFVAISAFSCYSTGLSIWELRELCL